MDAKTTNVSSIFDYANNGRTNKNAQNQQRPHTKREIDCEKLTLLRQKLNSRCSADTRVFCALFEYVPLRDSPNENPHLELTLHPDELILVHGQIDEGIHTFCELLMNDQFYFGETLDGRSGLVPSNYIEPISLPFDEETPQHQQQTKSIDETRKNAAEHSISSSNKQRHFSEQNCSDALMKNMTGTAAKEAAATFKKASSENEFAFAADGSKLSSAILCTSQRQTGSPSFLLPEVKPIVTPPENHLQDDFQQELLLASLLTHSKSFESETVQFAPQIASPAATSVDVRRVVVEELSQLHLATQHPPKVSCPRELRVIRNLSRSVFIAWNAPIETTFGSESSEVVSNYQVCVDGQVKAMVQTCRALIEDLPDFQRAAVGGGRNFANVSVRAVYTNGRHSADAACTIAIGKTPIAPQKLRVSNVTPTSCHVSWYPSDSNQEHVLSLNGVKVGVCQATVFQVKISGILPSTIYRLSVRTKQPKAVLLRCPVERCVDFKTLPKIGQPDPPKQVQVELGPQPGTLLVTWQHVSGLIVNAGYAFDNVMHYRQPQPPSRAAIDSYLIYADGKGIAEVQQAAADHILLSAQHFVDETPPIFLTVRTRTKEGAISADSNVVRVPKNFLRKKHQQNQSNINNNTNIDQQHLLMAMSASSSEQNTTTNANNQPTSGVGAQSYALHNADMSTSSSLAAHTHHQLKQRQQHLAAAAGAWGSVGGVVAPPSVFSVATQKQLPAPTSAFIQTQAPSNMCATVSNEPPPTTTTHMLMMSCLPPEYQQQPQYVLYDCSNPLQPPAVAAASLNPTTTTGAMTSQLLNASSFIANQQYQQQQQLQQQQLLMPVPAAFSTSNNNNIFASNQPTAAAAAPTTSLSTLLQHQQQQQRCYYAFHPTGLCPSANTNSNNRVVGGGSRRQQKLISMMSDGMLPTAAASVDANPNVLEMEQHYVLQHQQQQQRTLLHNDFSTASGGGGAKHSSSLPERRQFAGQTLNLQQQQQQQQRGMHAMTTAHHPPTRSFLGNMITHSEPDLRVGGGTIGGDREEFFGGNFSGDGEPRCRWFVAIHAYDPSEMSPNEPALVRDELRFRRHQLIKVHGDADPDGFFLGEVKGGRVGWVPSNLVIEIDQADFMLPTFNAAASAREFEGERAMTTTTMEHPAIRRTRWGSIKSHSYDDYAAGGGAAQQRRSSPFAPRRGVVVDVAGRERGQKHLQKHQQQQQQRQLPWHHQQQQERAATYLSPEIVPGGSSMKTDNDRAAPMFEHEMRRRLPVGGATRSSGALVNRIQLKRERQFEKRDANNYSGKSSPQTSTRHQHVVHHAPPHPHPQHNQQQQQMRNFAANTNDEQQHQPQHPQQQQQHYKQQQQHYSTTVHAPDQQHAVFEQPPPSAYHYHQQQQQQPSQHHQQQLTTTTTTGAHSPNLNFSNAYTLVTPKMRSSAQRMVAKFDYDPAQSPNPDGEQVEMSFLRGDLITVFGEMDDDGFYMGENDQTGQQGLVPFNFLDAAAFDVRYLTPADHIELFDDEKVVVNSHNFENGARNAELIADQQQQQAHTDAVASWKKDVKSGKLPTETTNHETLCPSAGTAKQLAPVNFDQLQQAFDTTAIGSSNATKLPPKKRSDISGQKQANPGAMSARKISQPIQKHQQQQGYGKGAKN